jgi:cell wall-associated NlpC family hydrolase
MCRSWLIVAAASGKRLAFDMTMRLFFVGLMALGAGASIAPRAAAAQSIDGLPDSSLLVVPVLPRELPAAPVSRLARIDSLVALARAQLGRRYRRGAESPTIGFDCSGLVQYVMRALNVTVPRTARDQARVGLELARDTAQLRPGDLLTFGSAKRVSHIGIYVGNGRFVHASTGAGRVVERPLLRAPAKGIKPWIGVRRLIADGDSASGVALGNDKAPRLTSAAGGG